MIEQFIIADDINIISLIKYKHNITYQKPFILIDLFNNN